MAEVKKKFIPNREAELKQTARVSQEKKKADANVQTWTKKTGGTKNLIKEYGATKANYARLNKKKKWYSGDKPTERETVAEMYRAAAGDEAKFSELEQMYKQEQRTIGSPIYNPYAEATNWKAIDGLTELGFDLSGGVTSEWLQQNQGLLNDKRLTTSSYNPAAPTKSSTAQQDAAYWFKELQDAEERTVAAETEYGALAKEVEYWAKQGYSDEAILNKVRGHFDSDYKTLAKMDEDRLAGSATLLNRKVNYSGDDTVLGMIWAARNDGGSGDYFVDAVNRELGRGNKYKADPHSEAARDPSNAEGYHPYITSNTHELNMKYGVDRVDMDWLEANRSMLNDPDQAKDWQTLYSAVENADAAAEQLAALDQWLEQQVEKGLSADDISTKLETLINDGGEVRYTDAEGNRATIKMDTLSKMEAKRMMGAYMELGYGVDFTLPAYIAKANEMVAERDAAAEAAAREAEANKGPGFIDSAIAWGKNAGEEIGRFIASAGDAIGLDGIGSYGDDVDAFLGAQKGQMTENDIARKYASDVLGVEVTGDLTEDEKALINDAMAKVDVSIQPRSSDEERAAASAAIEAVDAMLRKVAEDPSRRSNYMADEAYTSVYEKQPEEPREGMQEFTADPVAYTVAPMAEGQAGPVYEIPESVAYKDMLQGGEWDSNAILWAYNESSNPIAIEATLVEGILDKMRGEGGDGLGASWYDAHKDLIANTNPDLVHGALGREELDAYRQNPELRDSRRAYGSEVYEALMANQEALDAGAIEDEQYARNLIGIGFAVDAIKAASDGGKITDEQASAVIAGDASLQEHLAGATASAAAGMDDIRRQEADAQKKLIEVMDSYVSGAELDMNETMVVQSVLSMDVSKVAKADETYQDTMGYFDDYVAENLSVDALMQDGVSFSYGNEMDMSFDYLQLQQSGAAVYSRGVKDIAAEKLDAEMRMAAAYGMSLSEYYEAYPERARSGEQLIAEARAEYDTAWNEFGNTLYGLEEIEASMKAEDEEQVTKGEDILGPRDVIAFIIDKWDRSMGLNLAKTGNFLLYSGDKDQKVGHLRDQYDNNPEAFAADLNEWEKDELKRLQEIYEPTMSSRKWLSEHGDDRYGDVQSFEDWVNTADEAAYYREIKAQREANPDIFNIGMSVDEIKSNKYIFDQSANIANIDKVVAENGSEADNLAYGVGVSLMNSGTVMAATAAGGGGLVAAMAASAPEYLASGYDRYKETGNYNAAFLASAGEIVVNGLIEKVGFDRYVPDSVAGMLDNKVAHSKYILSHKGLAQLVKQPKAMSKVASGVVSGLVKGAMDSASEFMEEFSQAVVSAIADNAAYGEPILPSADQLSEATREAVMAFFTGPIFSMVSGSGISFSDDAGNALDAAKAQLLPEHDGAIINDAIEYQTSVVAIHNSQQELAQIEASSENAAKNQAQADVKAADAAFAEAQTELSEAETEYQAAAVALEDVNTEMQDSDAFTEDMQKRMSSAADAMRNARKRTEAAKKGWEKARAAQQEAKQRLSEAQAKVQAMYNEVMNRAKAEAEQAITNMFFGGDSEKQQAAMKVYRDACAKLMDAKNRLRSAKADAEMYNRTPRGDDAHIASGEIMLEIDALTEEVAAAKAEVEAAYAETGEGMMEAKQNDELIAAEESANAATEAAAADPMNDRAQQKAELEQAKLRTIRAKYDMEEKRSGISKRLQDPRNSVREEAVKEWNAIQGEANAAAAESEALQAEFDKTDVQKNLRTAIENMQRYSNDQLLFEDADGHEDAVNAYNMLQVARADAEVEARKNELDAASVGSDEYQNALNAYKKSVKARGSLRVTPGVDWLLDVEDGQVLTKQDRGQYFAALRGMQFSDEKRLTTNDDGFIIPTKTSLIFSRGNYDKPEIYGIIKVTGDDQEYVQYLVTELEDVLSDAKQENGLDINSAMEIIPYMFPEGNVQVYGRTRQGYEVRSGRGERSVSRETDLGYRSNGSGGRDGDIQAWRGRRERFAGGVAGSADAIKSPIEIMRELTHSIKVGYSPNGPMNQGRKLVSSDILAFYSKYTNGIRVRSKYAGDMAIGLHEFGHAAHARLKGLHATQEMIDALPDSVKNSYSDNEMDGEAIAEFVVRYMYGRDLAVQNAGEQFVRSFERMMRADPDLNAAVTRGRDQVELWYSASPESRAAAMIKDSTTAAQRDKEASKGGAKRLIEKAITQVFDANEPLRKLGKTVYDAAKWSRWASERADVLLKDNFVDPEGNFVGKSLNARLDDIGWTADMEQDAVTYGVCQIALERLKQKKPVFAENELSSDDLRDIMKGIKDRNPIAAKGADVISGFWKDVMDVWLVPSGVVKGETRDKFWEMYEHYLPTKRVVDVNWSKKDIKDGKFVLHAAKDGGVSLEVINPIQSIVDMTDKAVRTVSRNQVAQEIDNVLRGGGLDWLAKEITADMAVTRVDTDKVEDAVRAALDSGDGYDPDLVADAFNALDGLGEQWRSTGGTLRPNVIAGVRPDGTEFYYQIQQGNEDMFRAAMGSKNASHAYFRTVKKIVNGFSQLTTQLNPAFAGKNAVRDFFTSMNTGTWAWSYLDGAYKWAKGMYHIATNSKAYQEFEAMGGGQHDRMSTRTEKGLAAIRRDVLGKKDSFPVRAAKFGFKIFTLSDINDMIETNSRLVEYIYGKHDRSTFEGRREAAIAAQNVTTDFGMAGANEVLDGLLAHIPFGRAALNGTYKTVMMLRDIGSSDPKTRKNAAIALTKTTVNTGIAAAMQAYLLGAILGGDDDDELKQEEYALFTDEVKAGNLLIPLDQDKTNTAGFDRPWARIPLPQDVLTRAIFAFAFNQFVGGTDMDSLSVDLAGTAKSLLTDSLPGEFVTTNLSNAMMNRTWYGGQIVSDYIMDNRSGVNQYNDNTPAVFKQISNAVYNVTGREVSPAVLQYCFEQTTGYVGKVIMPLISGNRYTGKWTLGGAVENLVYSYLKNYTIDPLTSNNLSKDYKAACKKLNNIVSEAEAGLPITYLPYSLTDAEREDAYVEAKSMLKTFVASTDAEIKERWEEINEIETSERLSDGEKAIQIREVRREIDLITFEAMAEIGQYMQTYVDRDPWVTKLLNAFAERPALD